MFGYFTFDLSHQSGPGDANRSVRLHELSEVVKVEVVRPEVVERVDAHNGIEEAGGERQRPGVGVDRDHAALTPSAPDALDVLGGTEPQVGGPPLHAELPPQEDGRGGPAATEVQDPHAGPQAQR